MQSWWYQTMATTAPRGGTYTFDSSLPLPHQLFRDTTTNCTISRVYVLRRRSRRATPPTTEYHPATTKIPLDPLSLTPALFLTLSGCLCFFIFRSTEKCIIRNITIWTNSLFLNGFVIFDTLFQNNSFYFFELNFTSASIRIKIEESFLNILYYGVSLKYRSSLQSI